MGSHRRLCGRAQNVLFQAGQEQRTGPDNIQQKQKMVERRPAQMAVYIEHFENIVFDRFEYRRLCEIHHARRELTARLGISRQRGIRRYAPAVAKLVWFLNYSEEMPAAAGAEITN
jgi:hypothetical protein